MTTRIKSATKRAIKKCFSVLGLEVRRARGGAIAASKTRPSAGSTPYKRGSMDNLYEAADFLREAAVVDLNKSHLERIRSEVNQRRPLKIGFVVNDKSKWNADSLLKEMQDAGWSTQLYLCLSNARYADRKERADAYQAERDFFVELDKNLVDIYKCAEDRQAPIEDVVDADVVFYQQPWGMLDFPRRLVRRTLGAYMHYGFMLMANHGQHYHIGTFHSYLWRYFTQTEEHRLLHMQHDPFAHDKLVVTGYPKLDVYCDEPSSTVPTIWPDPSPSVRRIIYAPHHALAKGSLGMSTFAWTHDAMLDLARSTPNTQWVYKPHPLLRYKVVQSRVMTRQQYAAYEEAWAALPNAVVYDTGRYFDLFRSSDAMITDCGSFLAEYLPTGMPILWLVSPTSIGFNTVGDSLGDAFYQVRSVAELRQTFQRVVVDQADPLAPIRRAAITRLLPTGGRAATAVVEHLRRELIP